MDEQVLRGFTWFFAAIAVHVVEWRWFAPRRHLPCLLATMLGIPALMWTMHPHAAKAFIVAESLSLAYIQTYPAAQARSPSLTILGAARRMRSVGCVTRDDLADAVRSDMVLGIRFDDLVRERLLAPTTDGFRLTTAGRGLALAFVALRRLLNLGPGMG